MSAHHFVNICNRSWDASCCDDDARQTVGEYTVTIYVRERDQASQQLNSSKTIEDCRSCRNSFPTKFFFFFFLNFFRAISTPFEFEWRTLPYTQIYFLKRRPKKKNSRGDDEFRIYPCPAVK
jgi:hypothetical protein